LKLGVEVLKLGSKLRVAITFEKLTFGDFGRDNLLEGKADLVEEEGIYV